MITKKVLLSTFGAKIASYGFEFVGYEHHRFTFSRKRDGTEQSLVIQREPRGGKSFDMEINTYAGRNRDIEKLFWDLLHHYYKDDTELENVLNMLGDLVVERVIPQLPELSISKPDYPYETTEEMYEKLWDEKDELVQRFMERHQLEETQEIDAIIENLLREVEQIKALPFPQTVEIQIELAAVYGYIIIRNIGGEWIKERGKGVVENFSLPMPTVCPLEDICQCCQKGGGVELAKRYMTLLGKYGQGIEVARRKYGNNWQPPKTSEKMNNGLMTEEVVKETLAKNLEDIGFCYQKEIAHSMWELDRIQREEKLRVYIEQEECRRKTFFVTLFKYREKIEGYMYKKFCFYHDETELRMQLQRIGDEIKEAICSDTKIDRPEMYYCRSCHITKEMNERFCTGKLEMAERFRRRNGLDKTAGEEDILKFIGKELDAIKGNGYEESKEQLLELGAACGELIIREIGGHWKEDEEWRIKRSPVRLVEVPVIGTIDLPQELIYCWENGGSPRLYEMYRKYQWEYEEWKRLCYLAGLTV